jgi:hypothetical protein
MTNSTLNYGVDPNLNVDWNGPKNALIRFDVSAIPTGSQIVSATLTLTTSASGTEAGTIEVYNVTEAWSEGTLDGAAGEANWTARQTGVNWTTAGGTHDATILTTFAPRANATAYSVIFPSPSCKRGSTRPRRTTESSSRARRACRKRPRRSIRARTAWRASDRRCSSCSPHRRSAHAPPIASSTSCSDGKRPFSCLGKTSEPSISTSKIPPDPRLSSTSSPLAFRIAAARLAARRS